METKEIAQKIAAAANDKKAKDILLLNMEGLSPVTDFYVICSAGNSTLVKAIADNIEDKLAEAGVHPTHRKAMPMLVGCCWITVMLLLTFSWRKNAIFIT